MIYVSRYSNKELQSGKYTAVRISVGTPRWNLGYHIDGEIKDLMPFGLLGLKSKEEYERRYIERLRRVGADRIGKQLKEFEALGKDVVLLCYEDVRNPESWCHRTMFAEWWLRQTGEKIEELTDPSEVKLPKPKAEKKEPVKKKVENKMVDDDQLTLF